MRFAFILALSAVSAFAQDIRIERLANNPIIRPEMLPGKDGENINGPSLIRVPAWVKDRLGTYYLYFAHHNGRYIRMAYADKLEGPWKMHEGGVLNLADAPGAKGHIASPDVIVDEPTKQFRMYFHGPSKTAGDQKTFVALSEDGIHFKAREEILGIFYWRVFQWDKQWYGMAKGGLLYRSADGLTKFELGPNPLPGGDARGGSFNDAGPRHVAVRVMDRTLEVYYTSIGDEPERIFRTTVPLSGDWKMWKSTEPVEVLRPTEDWEGAKLPLTKSRAGAVKGQENALRDPAVFVDSDGQAYLLYSVAGESGIAIARIRDGKSQ